MSIANRVLDRIAGGWSLSGITTYRTGAPFQPRLHRAFQYYWLVGRTSRRVAGADLYAGQQSGA